MRDQTYKLYKACSRLGIGVVEAQSLVKIDPLPDVACWGINKETGEEFIYINPNTMKYSLPVLEMVLRHELLHAAGYNKIGGAGSSHLTNLCLDVSINYALWKAYPVIMRKFAEQIYKPETRPTPLCMVQCHLLDKLEDIKDKELIDIYRSIWESNEIPSPNSLYYKLIATLPPQYNMEAIKDCDGDNPCGGKENDKIRLGGYKGPRDKDSKDSKDKDKDQKDGKGEKFLKPAEKVFKKAAQQAREEAWKNYRKKQSKLKYDDYSKYQEDSRKLHDEVDKINKSFSDMESNLWSAVKVDKEEIDADKIKRLIEQMRIQQQLDEAANKLLESMGGKVLTQTYPYRQTRRSMVYMAAGVSKYLNMFWNRTPESRKPRLAIYVDTSPSMDSYKQYEVYLIDQLQEYFPTQMFVFAGSVDECNTKEFADGNYPQGSSTCFDAVFKHFLETDYEACLVFTDGESSVDTKYKEDFKEKRRRLFPIYFGGCEGYKIESNMDDIAEQVIQITKEDVR